MITKQPEPRYDLGRMTNEEYRNLRKRIPWRGVSKAPQLGRMTDEEYQNLWDGRQKSEEVG